VVYHCFNVYQCHRCVFNVYQWFMIVCNVYQWYGCCYCLFYKISGRHLFEHLMLSIYSEKTLVLLFWIDWHWLLFSFTNSFFHYCYDFLLQRAITVPLVKIVIVYVIAWKESDVTTRMGSVQMGIVMLDGKRAHVLKVYLSYFYSEVGLYG
jgi:hypothetical protein